MVEKAVEVQAGRQSQGESSLACLSSARRLRFVFLYSIIFFMLVFSFYFLFCPGARSLVRSAISPEQRRGRGQRQGAA